jgi:hypothetical protein
MNNLRVEFIRLKNEKNINGLVSLYKKVNNMGGGTTVIVNSIERIMNDKFTSAVNDMSPILFEKRGIEIRATTKPQNNNRKSFSTHFIALVKNDKNIAGMDAGIKVSVQEGKMNSWVELNSGWTHRNYSKTGPLRPTNGPGYGTIIRALIVNAAKKIGCMGAMQNSAIVSNENKNKFANGRISRPVSAHIMNKLGFNTKSVEKEPGTNRIKSEHRFLRLNTNTPKLNAVVRNILAAS